MRAELPGLLVALLALLPPTAPTADAQGRRPQRSSDLVPLEIDDCREVRRLGADDYWFWHGYFGVDDTVDVGSERQGRLELDERICFRVDLRGIDDARARTRGYRQAVFELIKWLPREPDGSDNGIDRDRVRRHLARITGRRPDDAAWLAWWRANADYVWWDDDAGHLAVVEDARAAGVPLHDDSIVLGPEEYWFYAARGWTSRVERRGDYLVGAVLIPPHGYSFRALVEGIDDRGAKQAGYRRALDSLMADGLALEDLSERSAEELMRTAAAITDRAFSTPDDWLAWWRSARERLVLSDNGRRLVVRGR